MILSFIGALALIMVVVGMSVSIIYFFGKYIIILAIAVASIAFAALVVKYLKSDVKKNACTANIIPSDDVTNALNKTHQVLLGVLLDIVKLKADLLKLVTPLTVYDIRAKIPYTVNGENGIAAWAIHHFTVYKSEVVRIYSLSAIRDTLHNSLLRMIDEGRIENLPRFHKYDNIQFVPMAVDSVIDNGNGTLQVNVVVIKDAYIEQLDEASRARLEKNFRERKEFP